MKSSFFEFHVASSALFTAKAGLQVTSHNIANNTTVGYSRQYAEQRATTPMATYNSRGMVGTGSEVYGVGQIRSFYLDKKYWNEMGVLGEHTTKKAQLSMMETIFNELSGTGLSSNFSSFFAKMSDLATNTPDATYRNNIIKYAESLSNFVNSTASSLQKQQLDINSEVSTVVSVINNLGEQIANLNQKIAKLEIDGSSANDLRDQRALLIDELSKYVNIEVSEVEINDDYAAGKYPNPEDRGKSDKRLSIMINGYEFVNNWDVNLLEVVPREDTEKRNAMDAEGLYNVQFKNGVPFDIYSPTLKGELKGLIDVRDGNNGAAVPANTGSIHKYKGIPYYLEKLNTLVRTFAMAINEGLDSTGKAIPDSLGGHVAGFDEDKESDVKRLFFTYADKFDNELQYSGTSGTTDYSGMNCFNFKVNKDILDDPMLLACSDNDLSGESNNKIILAFGALASYQSLFKEGKLSDYITGMTSELAIDRKQSENFEKNYTDVTKTIDNQRMQVSGVSLNEEVLSMIQYQQQYQAAAKLMSIINSIYDTMINQMGV